MRRANVVTKFGGAIAVVCTLWGCDVDSELIEPAPIAPSTGSSGDSGATGDGAVNAPNNPSNPSDSAPKDDDGGAPSGLANVAPADGAALTDNEASAPVTFRWTPLVPKPNEPVTYRLRVWQLMQGQNGTQAMKSNPPIVTKEVTDLTQAAVIGLYTGPCKPPYLCDFVWSMDASTTKGALGQPSTPTTFSVTEYTGLTNVFPAAGAALADGEATATVTFRWTPVVPKPKEPVTYRLKVWQLMQGQNGTQAMKTNAPIVTKSVVDMTEADVSAIYTGPCKPPYLCDLVWSMDASTTKGALGQPSTPTAFSVTQYTGLTNLSPADGSSLTDKEALAPVTFRWTPVVPKPAAPVTYRLRVWQLIQGQNGTQAMTNPPIVTKDVVDATEADVSGFYTGPCKPPYLCDFVWSMDASITTGAIGQPSAPTMFMVK